MRDVSSHVKQEVVDERVKRHKQQLWIIRTEIAWHDRRHISLQIGLVYDALMYKVMVLEMM